MKITLRYREYNKEDCVASGQEYFREVEVPEGITASRLCNVLGIKAVIEYTGFGDSGHAIGKWRREGPVEPGKTYSISLGDTRLQRPFLAKFRTLESIE